MKPVKILLLCLALLPVLGQADDDGATAAVSSAALPSLNAAQQAAAGVVIGHASSAAPAARSEAYALVLDPTSLIDDSGRVDSSAARAHAAATELSRLQQLYRGNAGAALKDVEAARARQAQAQAAASDAAARFSAHWGPLASQSTAARRKLIADLLAGRSVLLRADLPGRHSLGATPQRALLDVDGVRLPARVLGPLRQASPTLQSVGLLLLAKHPPAGLASGARLPAQLEGAPMKGRVVPASALLYGDSGAYVYRALPAKAGGGPTRFAPLPVQLLQPLGDGWLVSGIAADDDVVVHGAGVLWSLQGLGNVADDDD